MTAEVAFDHIQSRDPGLENLFCFTFKHLAAEIGRSGAAADSFLTEKAALTIRIGAILMIDGKKYKADNELVWV